MPETGYDEDDGDDRGEVALLHGSRWRLVLVDVPHFEPGLRASRHGNSDAGPEGVQRIAHVLRLPGAVTDSVSVAVADSLCCSFSPR